MAAVRPSWTYSIGASIDAGQTVRATCTGCSTFRDIDLVALAARMGRDYSLWNRRCRCRLTLGCEGWNRFSYSGKGVYRLMVDQEQLERWFEVDWAKRCGIDTRS